MAWGTRSDLTTVEGTIPEDSQIRGPLGGAAGYLTELTSTCDTSTSSSRGISIFAIGLGLSYTTQSDICTLQNEKIEALQDTITSANIASTVKSMLASDISAAEGYVMAAQGGGDFPSNINCALDGIAGADSYLRGQLGLDGIECCGGATAGFRNMVWKQMRRSLWLPITPYVPSGWPVSSCGGSDSFYLSCSNPPVSSENGTVAVTTFQFAVSNDLAVPYCLSD